jgi:hypothetical protein
MLPLRSDFKIRTRGDSHRRSDGPVKSINDKAGVTVSATKSDARIARTYASASGWKNEPESPCKKKTGTKTGITIRLA